MMTAIDGATALASADWLLLALIVVWLPVQEFIALPVSRRTLDADAPGARLGQYNQSIALLWLTTGAIALVWTLEERNASSLGLRFDGSLGEWGAMAIAGLIGAALLYQLLAVRYDRKTREAFRKAAGAAPGVARLMPRTGAELRRFMLVGLTAGVAEEIIFRGFLIWALSAFIPVWTAALLALVLFVVLHAYQGAQQLVGVAVAGAVMTALYVASGSLYPAVIAHIVIDVLQGMTWWIAMRPRRS